MPSKRMPLPIGTPVMSKKERKVWEEKQVELASIEKDKQSEREMNVFLQVRFAFRSGCFP
jgi:hypothetical protein